MFVNVISRPRFCAAILAVFSLANCSSSALASNVVDEQRGYAAALFQYVDAEIEVQVQVVRGVEELHRLGHASVYEYEEAELKLSRLRLRKHACDRHLKFLNEFGEPRAIDASTSRRLAIDLRRVIKLPVGPPLIVVRNWSESSNELVEQLSTTNEQRRNSERMTLEARIDFVQQLARRIESVGDLLPAEKAEVERLRLHETLLHAEVALIAATPDQYRIIDGSRRSFRGGDLRDVQTQLSLMTDNWQHLSLKAESDSLKDELILRTEQHRRLVNLHDDVKALPFELVRSETRLRQLTRQKEQVDQSLAIAAKCSASDFVFTNLASAAPSLIPRLLAHSELARRTVIELQSTETQLQQVAILAETDDFFASERDWLSKRFEIMRANSRVREVRSVQLYALHSATVDNEHLVSISQSTELRPAFSAMKLLREIADGELEKIHLEKAKVDVVLAIDNLNAVEQLAREGHASWKEVATATMMHRVRQAEFERREIDLAAATLHRQLIDKLAPLTPPLDDASLTLR